LADSAELGNFADIDAALEDDDSSTREDSLDNIVAYQILATNGIHFMVSFFYVLLFGS